MGGTSQGQWKPTGSSVGRGDRFVTEMIELQETAIIQTEGELKAAKLITKPLATAEESPDELYNLEDPENTTYQHSYSGNIHVQAQQPVLL